MPFLNPALKDGASELAPTRPEKKAGIKSARFCPRDSHKKISRVFIEYQSTDIRLDRNIKEKFEIGE